MYQEGVYQPRKAFINLKWPTFRQTWRSFVFYVRTIYLVNKQFKKELYNCLNMRVSLVKTFLSFDFFFIEQ